MDSEIYERARDLACSLVNASGAGDTKEYWSLYHELEALCQDNEIGEKNHPFQWETLADFTTDDGASIEIYEKAFALAENVGLSDYMASVKFALAERYRSLNLAELAYSCAEAANEYAKGSSDLELRQEISEFLLNEQENTQQEKAGDAKRRAPALGVLATFFTCTVVQYIAHVWMLG